MTDFRDKLRNPSCELCPLHESADHVCLMGGGPKKSDIMIVGEAPGAREDESHVAFVGPSGKLLDAALDRYADIKRADCYVTNVAKCRPPDNRSPELKEIKMCVATYFDREVAKVKPKFMLLLGNSALRGVTKKSGITKKAGVPMEMMFGDQEVTVFAALHPAAILRNPKNSEGWVRTIEMFGKLTRYEKLGDNTKVYMVNTPQRLRWLIDKLEDHRTLAWDIETFTEPAEAPHKHTSFQDWWGDESRIVSLSVSWEEGSAAFVPLWHNESPFRRIWMEVLEKLRPAMCRDGSRMVAHNGKFDARWMHSKGVPVAQTFDTMLAAHMLEENRPKGLKPLSMTLLRQPGYDVGEELKEAHKIPLRRLATYNSKDSDYTYRLYQIFRRELVADMPTARIFKRLMMPASEALVDIERYGVYIDQERWRTRHDEAQEKVERLYAFINTMVPDTMRPINLNSPPQVGQWLYGHLGLPILERTAKGQPTTREGALLELLQDHPHKGIEALMKYRKWAKFLSTYLLPWYYEHMDNKGRIHSNYKLFGTVTGRLSGEGGIQQVPRDPFIRSIVGATPGWAFVQADYSQIELRIAAMISGDRYMLSQYLKGEDIHMNRACAITGKTPDEVTKEERKQAKAVNFGFIYGMGAEKFVQYAFENYDVRVTLEEAEEVRNGFFREYSSLLPWHDRQRRLARRYRHVRSPIGRVRHLPDIASADKMVASEAERQAINSPVQSMASDMMLASLVVLHQAFDPKQARIVGTVHDSILFEIKDKYVDRNCELIKATMEDKARVEDTFDCSIPVPIVVDIETGTHWGEGEPWKGKDK